MTKMKRTLAFVVAVVGLTLAAGSASALSSLNLVWVGSGTDSTAATSGNITAKIILQGDSPEGIGGIFVTILFDTAELDFVSALEHSGPSAKVGMGNQFAPVSPGVAVDEGAGVIAGFDSTTGTATGCISCTVTLGSVIFNVVAPSDADGPNDVRFFVDVPGGIDGIVSAFGGTSGGALTTIAFGNAELVGPPLPEPTTALLVVGGLLGLGYAGRRGARD